MDQDFGLIIFECLIMKSRFILIIALALFFSVSGFAQHKPAWITSVENTIKKKEKFWKIENKFDRPQADSYSFTLKSGNTRAGIQITAYRQIANPEETFTGLVTAFDSTVGKNLKKTDLANLGNEGYMWTGPNGNSASLMFRKDKVFVRIFAPSEKIAKRFAQYVFEQIP
jgi:hypothetical protein